MSTVRISGSSQYMDIEIEVEEADMMTVAGDVQRDGFLIALEEAVRRVRAAHDVNKKEISS